MGARAREWVAAAVLGGQASDARLRLKGDLRDFPFTDPAKGQFQVAAKVSGAVLDYASGWPRIEEIDGDLLFERDRIDIVGRSGNILGAKLANVRVSLPSMLDPNPQLHIDGSAEGPTAVFLDYIRQSPVRRMVEGFTDGHERAWAAASCACAWNWRCTRWRRARSRATTSSRPMPSPWTRACRPSSARAGASASPNPRSRSRRARPAVRRPGPHFGRHQARRRRRGDRGGQGDGRRPAPGCSTIPGAAVWPVPRATPPPSR